MSLTLSKNALPSRSIRKQSAGNSSGLRKINFSAPPLTLVDKTKGLFSRFTGAIARFGGWAFSIAKWFGASISGVWDWLIERGYDLAYFDWNQTDAQLRESLAASLEGLARSAGGLVGGAVGWILSAAMGFGVSLVFPVIGGSLLAKWVAGNVIKEGIEETVNKLESFARQALGLTAQYVAVETYISTRKLLRGPEAGQREQQPWTIAGSIEEKIRSIPNRYLRAFVEGALEDGTESFIEGGYIVAQELETAWEARNGTTDPDRSLYLKPDKDSDEQFYLSGGQGDVKDRALQVLDQARVLNNRDVGHYVGQIEDRTVIPQVQRRSMKIHYRHKPRPPYNQSDPDFRKAEFSIPDVRTGITWRELKAATKPFTAGRYRVTSFLDNGRQMTVFAVSAREGKQKIRELLTLSTAKHVRWSTGELESENAVKRMIPQVVYPWKVYLSTKTQSPAATADAIDFSGNGWDLDRFKVELFRDEEPLNYPPAF